VCVSSSLLAIAKVIVEMVFSHKDAFFFLSLFIFVLFSHFRDSIPSHCDELGCPLPTPPRKVKYNYPRKVCLDTCVSHTYLGVKLILPCVLYFGMNQECIIADCFIRRMPQ
jgi:hypothetical protein